MSCVHLAVVRDQSGGVFSSALPEDVIIKVIFVQLQTRHCVCSGDKYLQGE